MWWTYRSPQCALRIIIIFFIDTEQKNIIILQLQSLFSKFCSLLSLRSSFHISYSSRPNLAYLVRVLTKWALPMKTYLARLLTLSGITHNKPRSFQTTLSWLNICTGLPKLWRAGVAFHSIPCVPLLCRTVARTQCIRLYNPLVCPP
jgi:hypothetical protein